MTKELHSLQYGEHQICYKVVRRRRKTLEIAVEPDTSVVIAAPEDATLDAIEARLRRRAAWVIRQQRYFAQFQPRTPERRFVAGETFLYLGRQCRLQIRRTDLETVKLTRGFLVVQTRAPEKREVIQRMVKNWYRERAHIKFPERIAMCHVLFQEQETFRPKGLIIREMRARWGSLSTAGRLLLTPRLLSAPVDCIDYVITHELCHLAHHNHSDAFYKLLKNAMPDWEKRKQKLERFMA
jgi:predicted metal-dependent hydrolase